MILATTGNSRGNLSHSNDPNFEKKAQNEKGSPIGTLNYAILFVI